MNAEVGNPPSTSAPKPTRAWLWGQGIWVCTVAVTLAAIVSEPLTVLDGIDKLLSGWREFTRSLWRNLLILPPPWLRPYGDPLTYDVITVLALLAGGLGRSTKLQKPASREEVLHDLRLQVVNLFALILIFYAVVVWPNSFAYVVEDGNHRLPNFYPVFWGLVTMSGVIATVILFVSLEHLRDRKRGVSVAVRNSYLVLVTRQVALLLVLILFLFVVSSERGLPHAGLLPSTYAEWQMSLTAVILIVIGAVEMKLLFERRSVLFVYIVAVAAAILVIGCASPFLLQAMTDAGWIGEGQAR